MKAFLYHHRNTLQQLMEVSEHNEALKQTPEGAKSVAAPWGNTQPILAEPQLIYTFREQPSGAFFCRAEQQQRQRATKAAPALELDVTSVMLIPPRRSAFSVSPIRTRSAASAASCLPCFLLCAVTAGNQRPPTFA